MVSERSVNHDEGSMRESPTAVEVLARQALHIEPGAGSREHRLGNRQLKPLLILGPKVSPNSGNSATTWEPRV